MSLLLRTWLVPLFLLAASVALAGCDEAESMTLGSGVVWPPEVGEPFPDVELTNYDGRKFKISFSGCARTFVTFILAKPTTLVSSLGFSQSSTLFSS